MSINLQALQDLKAATVGISVLVNPGENAILQVFGTGFFVSNKGYVMTANHVAAAATPLVSELAKQGHKVGLVAVWLKDVAGASTFELKMIPMEDPYVINLGLADASTLQNIEFADDLDVAILQPKPEFKESTPFLTIKDPSTPSLYEEIAMCGYPSGGSSLNISPELLSLRLSPVIQFGRIAGLLPTDNMQLPQSIQTDIIGTGGSSGSAIIELSSGKVIALAQKVLPARGKGIAYPEHQKGIFDRQVTVTSNIGLVYGISHNLLHDIPEGARKDLEEGIPFKSAPKFSITKREGWKFGA